MDQLERFCRAKRHRMAGDALNDDIPRLSRSFRPDNKAYDPVHRIDERSTIRTTFRERYDTGARGICNLFRRVTEDLSNRENVSVLRRIPNHGIREIAIENVPINGKVSRRNFPSIDNRLLRTININCGIELCYF